ncbi:hypothetical protein B0H14DRAFT_2660787 [Mycena olivaceomarginata]|uniref:Proteasome assembly chaperone 3 n=1 Tax=Mycena albidolilacea TaxID=1033008 RepID=A0AAD6ZYC4_9AGAR|nr:hypothetical protein DFH08DRAFT_225954 [Mycena albidolilacea]KAJ7905582.1 hypothetical protein B0H14DRAFT_2660787 [Mycena olivaceomarginata]
MTRQLSRELVGNTTEILIQTFADRILVLVTQLGKVGNLIQATIPDTIPLLPAIQDPDQPNIQALPEPPAGILLTPLLGNAPSEHLQTLHCLYASQIATLLWTAGASNPLEVSRRPVVVGIALRKSNSPDDGSLSEDERSVFTGVMSMVQELVAAAPR